MPRYLIERSVPGAGQMTPAQLQQLSSKSNAVLSELGSDILWDHSYVAGEKIYCVYVGRDEAIIREHARCGGFPIDNVAEIAAIIDPSTAQS